MSWVRAQLAAGLDEGRFGLAALFQDLDPQRDERQAWQVGSFYQALMSGIVVQWLVDLQHAPTGRDMATALRSISGAFRPDRRGRGATMRDLTRQLATQGGRRRHHRRESSANRSAPVRH